MEHLNAASNEDFMEFYRTFYVPNNAVLSIAGDLDPAKTRKLIERYFADIPRGTRPIPRPTIQEPRRAGEVRDTVWGKDALPMVVQAYPIPEQGSKDFYAVAVLNQILSGGESSRLNKRVVDKDQTALYCGAFNFSLEDPGLTLAYALVNMGVEPTAVEQAINEEVERLRTTPVDERELTKVKNQIESEFVQSNSSVAGIAESLANYHMYFGDAGLINTEVERYLAVTPADIQRVASTYYTPDQRVTLYFLQQQP
jgi:predicted Zn-dependent peptidase